MIGYRIIKLNFVIASRNHFKWGHLRQLENTELPHLSREIVYYPIEHKILNEEFYSLLLSLNIDRSEGTIEEKWEVRLEN